MYSIKYLLHEFIYCLQNMLMHDVSHSPSVPKVYVYQLVNEHFLTNGEGILHLWLVSAQCFEINVLISCSKHCNISAEIQYKT